MIWEDQKLSKQEEDKKVNAKNEVLEILLLENKFAEVYVNHKPNYIIFNFEFGTIFDPSLT